ncbi:efflux RND transporter permease subunit [Novosphingobium cyanobacteriorum]|uniref:Efflux RND transporter permease subunit n=1 Tax=Novosphingobium cyanobacteriorum TaxID=3024215 RepID=A0ABT6CGG2_9SPHN|nr:efflux RND transporter permease subunit [Novosphingobium cyanobacteriorum]MDF8332907.1 efflux RND transporter permease subunit [Novosphingobium cyanobacteriorum]
MNFRNISAWSIRNPVVPIVMFIGLTLAGIVAFMGMKVQDQPDIEFPMVIVQISQPGAAPTEIENQITQRVESAVRTIAGVDTITSTASEGSSQTMVMFKIGTDINAAVNEVKNQVDQVRGNLPEGILEPQVFKAETSSDPIAYWAVSADDMTMEQLSWFVDDTVAKRLLQIPGMASVERAGGVNREIAVTLDPMRMKAQGVTATQINAALRQVNLNAAGGKAEVAGSRQAVRVLGNARTAFDLSQTEINVGGRFIKLTDVADVRDSYSEITSIAKTGGKPVVTFSIARARGESDVSVYDAAVEELGKLRAEQGNKIKFTQLFTSVGYTKEQYKTSMSAMVEGAVLAVIVVFFFLRDWRATIVSAIAIPLSSIPTFWVLSLMGITLNTMSLLALGLVAGVLVDDAIVEIENIVRHMRMGKSAYQAAIDAADEIGLAVVATTFSIVAVFFPVALMPGVSGQFFKNFGFTVVIAVLFSLLVARMITPMVAAYFLKAHGEEEHGTGPMMDRYMAVLRWSLDTSDARAYRAQHPRRRFRARLRDHRLWMMGIGAGALLLTGVLFVTIPTQFFPDTDSDFSRISIEMAPGTTIRQTEQKIDEVLALVKDEPEIDVALERINEGSGRIFLELKKDRERSSLDFERQLTPRLQQVADARVSFLSNTGGPGGGSGRPISVMLSGSDPDKLQRAAQELVNQMSGLKSVVGPRISADLRRPEIVITPHLDLAASLGVTTQTLSQVIRIATQGEIDQNSAKFSLSDRQVPIRVKLPESSRRDLSTIEELPVPTVSGGSVPLSRVASISFGSGPTTIQRYNQNRRIFVGADLPQGVVKGTAMNEINALPIMKNLPQGVSNAPAGEDRWQQEMLSNFLIALVAGVFLVFAVLVLLYHRFISPLVNMGSLFLAPLGGLILLLLTGQSLSLPVFIGILMLFGIVAKNSILLIDFAIEEMAAGQSKLAAITEAGHKRAQPIVMTTVAMIAGMVPTAVSIGGDGGWRSPMGIVVIGGLTLSTLLTLLIVPAGFSLADGLEKRLGPWIGRRVLSYDPQAAKATGAGNHGAGEAFPAE